MKSIFSFSSSFKMIVYITFLIILTNACTNQTDIVLTPVDYQDILIEKCTADSVNKYHILVPENLDPSQKLPLVIALDPHGDGKLAVEKFRPAVRYFPCLVAGSDLIKNNFPGFENAIFQLIQDIERKYAVDNKQIIIAGFSGGARMAYYFALNHQLKGVLMCGAGPGQQKPSCPVYAISGMGGFNFAEQYQHPDIRSFNDDQFTSDYFHGIHEWPQPQLLSDGLICLLGDNSDLENLRRKRSHDLILIADTLGKKGDELLAWKALEKAAKLSVSKKESDKAVEQGNSLLKNEDFRNNIKLLDKALNTETRLKQVYAQRSLTENFDWWKNELTALNKNLETYKTGINADHYQRIKGFIGILLYSRINKMIYDDPSNPQLVNLLETYAFAEPENSYAWYFKALHDYQSGDTKSCIDNLNKALKLGFTDLTKMQEDFPADIRNNLKPKN